MAKRKDGSEKIAENLGAIQEGFQKVLDEHGVHNLRVSHFRLLDVEHKGNVTAAITAESVGCWKWICEMTPTGPICHEVWNPDC
jgi:4-alpha-glucanotransferase